MRLSIFSILILFFTFPTFLFSQKHPIKFGKLSKAEKAIESTELDPEADAVILCDFEEIHFEGVFVNVTRHKRIKILTQNGVEEANITIPFYSKDKREKILKVKAHTLNVGKDGKVEKVKVSKKEFYTVDINEYWSEVRFALKDVRPGSIIEYEFKKKSEDAISLEEWKFQNKLPTLKSQINVLISQGLDYSIVYNGRRIANKYGNKKTNSWSLENLPPIKEEPLCPNPEDYVESVKFQLAGYQSNSGYIKVMSSWEKLAKDLLTDQQYIKVLNKRRPAKKMVEEIITEGDSDLEKVKKIYAYVQENLEWSSEYRLFPSDDFSDIMEAKRGGSADINLCLVRLLQSADLDANPLIISTKRHGLVTKVYPIYRQFNHVLAQVSVDGKDILMDAISNFRPYNLIAETDLNPYGYLLNKKSPRWVDIQFPKRNKSVIVNDLSFVKDTMKFKTTFSFFDYYAVDYRSGYHAEKGKNSFVTKYLLDEAASEMKLDSFSVKNGFDFEKPFSVTCYFSKPMEEDLEADILYIEPMIKKHYLKNPFVKPFRYLPVDFVVPSSEKYILHLHIPEGFELAEALENINLGTESKKGNYTYQYSQPTPSQVHISSHFKITDPLIMPDEYGALRELFNRMMGLQAAQVVLKRK